MHNQWFKRLSVSMVILGLLAAACQAAGETPVAAVSQTPDTSQPTFVIGEKVDIQLEVGPGSFYFSDKTAGLADLSRYTASLIVSFDGTEAGQAVSGSTYYEMLYAKEPLARLLTITDAADPSASPSLLAEFDEKSYEVSDAGVCTLLDAETESNPSRIDRLEPVVLLHSVFGAEDAGQETIGEIPANHYIFDQRALVESGISAASGEMWVAIEGGTLLRYQLSITADQDYFGEGIEGTITWDYELTDLNQTPPPVLPDSCWINAPLLADASNVLNLPDWLAFDTASSVDDATAFYQEQMPALGWVAQPNPYITETDTLLEFVRGDQTLDFFITLGDGNVTRVNIVRVETEE